MKRPSLKLMVWVFGFLFLALLPFEAFGHTKGISLARYGLVDITLTGNVIYSAYTNYSEAYPELTPYIGEALPRGITLKSFDVSFTADLFQFPAKMALFTAFGDEGASIEEAFILFHKLPANLQAKVGRFRGVFGKLNQYHDHQWIFVNPPMINTALAGEDGFKVLGEEVTYLFPTTPYIELVLDIAKRETDGVFKSKLDPVTGEPDASDLLYIAKTTSFFDLTEVSNIEFGATFATGGNNSLEGNDDQTRIYGVDFTYKYKPQPYNPYVRWTTEFFWADRELGHLGVPDQALKGLYSEVNYRFSYYWDVGARFDLVSGNVKPEDPTFSDVTKTRLTGALRYFFNPVSRVNFQIDYLPATHGTKDSVGFFLQFNIGLGTVTPGVGKFYTLF